MDRVRLTWSLTPHSPAEELTDRRRRYETQHRRLSREGRSAKARLTPSPPRAEDRPVDGQDLPLSRTMLSNQGLPYVGRFAYGWHRLATTDPHAVHAAV